MCILGPSTSFNPVLEYAIIPLVNNDEEFEEYRDSLRSEPGWERSSPVGNKGLHAPDPAY